MLWQSFSGLADQLPFQIPLPFRAENGVEYLFIRLFEKVHCPPEHLKMPRLHVGHKVLLGIPFFKKKESIFILDTLAEVAAIASRLQPYGTGQ
jgi:hypothetical protein